MTLSITRAAFAIIFASTLFFVAVKPTLAHPHILANVKLEIIYGSDGSLEAVREAWIYDPWYSAFVLRQGAVTGPLSETALRSFAKQQIQALAEFGYYTTVKMGNETVPLSEAIDWALSQDAGATLTLHFTLPLVKPRSSKKLAIEIFDPQFFAYFTTAKESGVAFKGAPSSCSYAVTTPAPIDLNHTASIPAAFWEALNGSAVAGQQFVNKVLVECL